MKVAIWFAAFCLFVAPAWAQRPSARRGSPATTVDRQGEAYAQFLMAQRLEEGGDVDGAIAAYQRAITADPQSADLLSALADLYLRQSRAAEATATANQALALAPDNAAAHRVLGTILGSIATADAPPNNRQAQTQKDSLDRAIGHLEQALAPAGRENDVTVRAMLARLYVVAEKFDKAIPLLTQLVKEEPQWQEGAGLLVQAYAASGRAADAIGWLEEAAPESPQLYATLADFYGRERRWRDAANAYAQAVEAMPRGYDLRLRYASALLSTGDRADVGKARQVVTEALGLRASDERAMLLMNQVERRSGDLEAAEQVARRIVAQNARSARGYVALAETLEERQRYQDVISALTPGVAEFKSAASSNAALALLLPHVGFAYQQLRQFDRSIATFEDLLKLAPGDQALTAYLVQAHLAAKNYTVAAELARKARTDHPDDLRLGRLEAQALKQSGKPDQGVAVLESVVQKRTDDPSAYVALAQMYNETSHGAQAVSLLQDARTKFPKSDAIVFELGAVFDKQKRYADAESAFQQLITRDPENAAALNYLGYMLAERGERLEESVAYLKRALQIEPENGSYLDSIGWAYYKIGKLDLAADNLKRAAAQLTSNSVIQDHFGDVLYKMGRYDEAVSAWTRALAGDSESVDRQDIDKKLRAARQKLPKR